MSGAKLFITNVVIIDTCSIFMLKVKTLRVFRYFCRWFLFLCTTVYRNTWLCIFLMQKQYGGWIKRFFSNSPKKREPYDVGEDAAVYFWFLVQMYIFCSCKSRTYCIIASANPYFSWPLSIIQYMILNSRL